MPKLKENLSAIDEAPATENSDELDPSIVLAARAASDKKAIDPIVLDLRSIASFTDYFLILSGTNARQVQAIADGITETLKASGLPSNRVEGYAAAEWVLIDYGSFIVHVFDEKSRRFYDLERLWRDGRRIELSSEIGGAANASSLKDEA